jgi:Fe-S cluster assembly iron-binding protein IscA
MQIILSNALHHYLFQTGKAILRIKLVAARCCQGTFYSVAVDTQPPANYQDYIKIEQEGISIYVASKLAHHATQLELDYGRQFFQPHPYLAGPEPLLETVLMGFV